MVVPLFYQKGKYHFMDLGQFKLSDRSKNFEINNDVSKLFFSQTFTAPKLGDLGTTYLQQCRALLGYWYASVNNTKLTIQRFGKDINTKFICQGMPLTALAEICANHEGFVLINPSNPADPLCTTYIAKFSVELCLSGAIRLNGGDYIRLDFEGAEKYNDGLGGGAGSADSTFDIMTIVYYSNINEHVKYTSIAAKANAQTPFNCESHYMIALPWNTQRAVLYSSLGSELQLTNKELDNVSADGSDLVFVLNGTSLVHNSWRCVPLQLIYKGTLQVPTDTVFHIISNKNYEPVAPAPAK